MSPRSMSNSVALIATNTAFTGSAIIPIASTAVTQHIQQHKHINSSDSNNFVLSVSCYVCIEYTRDTGSHQRYLLTQLHRNSDTHLIQLYIDEIDHCLYCTIQCDAHNHTLICLQSNKPILYNTWLNIQLHYIQSNTENKFQLRVNKDATTIITTQSFQWSNCSINIGKSFIGVINNISLHSTSNKPTPCLPLIPSNTAVQPIPTRTLPIRSLKQLRNIGRINDTLNKSATQYILAHSTTKRQRVIHCHDFHGGYNNDAIAQSTSINPNTLTAYNFTHWNLIDIFIYFTHERVSIPTKSYIDQCHKHNVLCLGTFITEWDAGSKELYILLENQTTWQMYADKLIQVALYYGFDGYLINVESNLATIDNTVDVADYVNRLQQFLQYLTQQIHAAIPHSMIIWYDSISCISGCIDWQSELNEHNQSFFDITDAIFLDYKYNNDNLIKSYQAAGNRNYDVYVGIDVYGRGQYGGGGFNCCAALELIQQNQLSIALFGAGWTDEVVASGVKATRFFYELADNKFWLGKDYMDHVITQYDPPMCNNDFQQQYDTQVQCYVSVASAKICTRGVKYILHELLQSKCIEITPNTIIHCIQMYCGSGPNYADPLRWTVTLTDVENNVTIDLYDTGALTATAEWQTLTYTFNAYNILTQCNNVQLTWYVECSDAEHWAGYHGTKLADGMIIFTGDIKCSSTSQYVKSDIKIPTLDQLLPLQHSFNTGIGQRMYVDGKSVNEQPWYQLVQQDNQSVVDIQLHNNTVTVTPIQCILTMSTAYTGGNSIAFRAVIDDNFQPIQQTFNILTFNNAQPQQKQQQQYELCYTVKHSKLCTLVCYLYDNNNQPLSHTIHQLLYTSNNWFTYHTTVTIPSNGIITSLKCTFSVPDRIITLPHCVVAYLGQISIAAKPPTPVQSHTNDTHIPCTLHSAQWQVNSSITGVDKYSAVVHWDDTSASMYDVYCDEQWIGRTNNTYYYINDYIDCTDQYQQYLTMYYVKAVL